MNLEHLKCVKPFILKKYCKTTSSTIIFNVLACKEYDNIICDRAIFFFSLIKPNICQNKLKSNSLLKQYFQYIVFPKQATACCVSEVSEVMVGQHDRI